MRLLAIISILFLSHVSAQTPIDASNNPNGQFSYKYFDGLTREKATSTINYLENNYVRVMEDLRVNEMPQVTVYLYADYNSLYQAQEVRLGRKYTGSAGFVWWIPEGEPEIHQIYDVQYEDRRDHTNSLAHEFAHLVSSAVNPTISNNPRWLWEAVALYESEMKRSTLPQMKYLADGDYPTLSVLNNGLNEASVPRNVYDVGYVIAEYVVQNWGMDGLISLIKTNGNISDTLGLSEAEFERGWHKFLEDEYL